MHLKLAYGFFDDARESATPTGVDCGDGAAPRVDKENRDTVGGLNAEKKAGRAGDGGIAFAGFLGSGTEEMNDVGMNLPERDESQVGGAEGGLEKAAVFEDVFTRVPVGEAEVENLFVLESADAAGSGAEAVDEPGELIEGPELEDAQASSRGEGPGRRDCERHSRAAPSRGALSRR